MLYEAAQTFVNRKIISIIFQQLYFIYCIHPTNKYDSD